MGLSLLINKLQFNHNCKTLDFLARSVLQSLRSSYKAFSSLLTSIESSNLPAAGFFISNAFRSNHSTCSTLYETFSSYSTGRASLKFIVSPVALRLPSRAFNFGNILFSSILYVDLPIQQIGLAPVMSNSYKYKISSVSDGIKPFKSGILFP